MDEKRDTRTPVAQDAATESALLQHVLALHPGQISLEELLRELGGDDFARRDAVERAVRDLVGAGLLRRNGEFVVPTVAALRFDELLAG